MCLALMWFTIAVMGLAALVATRDLKQMTVFILAMNLVLDTVLLDYHEQDNSRLRHENYRTVRANLILQDERDSLIEVNRQLRHQIEYMGKE